MKKCWHSEYFEKYGQCQVCAEREPLPVRPESTGSIPAWVQDEIKATWRAARDAGNQLDSFRIIERMTDRLGYGRLDNNPSLAEQNAGRELPKN